MPRIWIRMVALGILAAGCGSKTQEQIFRQDGVDAAKGNAWSDADCRTAARADVDAQSKDHAGWTPTQRTTYEAAYVDGCLSALEPLRGIAQ